MGRLLGGLIWGYRNQNIKQNDPVAAINYRNFKNVHKN